MSKKRYQSPSVLVATELETECSILVTSQIKFKVKVDPLEEYYFEGEGTETSDHLIEL